MSGPAPLQVGPGREHVSVLNVTDAESGPLGETMNVLGLSSGSSAWAAANRAYYVPVLVRRRMVVTGIALVIGTTNTGNIDVGIYDEDGRRIVSSGSTPAGAVSTPQIIDIADTVLPPGTYYVAVAADATTLAINRLSVGNPLLRVNGVKFQSTTGFPLPATATMAELTGTTSSNLPDVMLLAKAVI